MVANSHVTGDHYAELANQIDQLNRKIDNIGRRTPNSLFVQTGAGEVLVDIGPSGWYDVDGNELNSVSIFDPISGHGLLKQFPATIDGNVGTDWYWAMCDAQGNNVVATDGIAGVGLAQPYIPVCMSMRWTGGPFRTATATGSAAAVASSIVGMGVLWEGRIGYVSHPALLIDGTWGDIDNAGITPTYAVTVSGIPVGTWTGPGGQAGAQHIFDVRQFVGHESAPVQISVTSTGGAPTTDRIACDVLGVHLSQSPAVWG